MNCKNPIGLVLAAVLVLSFTSAYAENIDPNDDGSQYAYGENIDCGILRVTIDAHRVHR